MAKDSGKVMIHGKEYQTVAYRVGEFRKEYTLKDGWAITTEIIERTETEVVMKASISHDGVVLATGHGEEQRDSSMINKTSALENCETSAIGRALASGGLAGTEFASADEVANAIKNQDAYKPSKELKATDKQREFIANLLAQIGVEVKDQLDYLITQFGIEKGQMSQADASMIIEDLQAEIMKIKGEQSEN